MDLSSATIGQQQIITTLDAPLSVAAGAGSGKTFTLTNRIGYALLGSEQDTPYIESIDELLATTFSKAGAEEMKSRIRALLREEGLDEQARLVDEAWITTIHGVCSRILREHALEVGIDPSFEVIEDARVKELWTRALNTVLHDLAGEGSNDRLSRLPKWYPASGGPNETGLPKFLTTVLEKAQGLPCGFESVYIAAPSTDLSRALRSMIELGEQYQEIATTWEKMTKYDERYLEELTRALNGAQAYLAQTDLEQKSFTDDDFDMTHYLEVLLAFPKTSQKYRNKQPEADFFAYYRQTYADIACAVMGDAAASMAADLLSLTNLVDQEYRRLKGPRVLDNADLLRCCCQALEDYPELRRSYQQRFKLIMVDEFQDTDLLQVAIIDHLSRDHGSNVMTVGDAQQSLYRFRGADVEVFFQHRLMQQEAHDSLKALSLPDNFRSHGDILKFVDTIFSRPAFFGDEFLSLQPRGVVNDSVDPLFEENPRILMSVIDAHGNAVVKDARTRAAEHIARHFADLRDRGASPSDMVILLGGMSYAKTYSQALEKAGFESIVAGGSVFAKAQEVQLIEALLIAFADRFNSTALYQVLSSPLFNLSDAIFFAIARFEPSQKESKRGSFAKRFWSLVGLYARDGFMSIEELFARFGLSSTDLEEFIRVLDLLVSLSAEMQRQNYCEGLYQLLLHSGWLYRLQASGAEGLSIVANLHKALEIISDWQQEGCTLPEVACDFSDLLSISKQSPGVLSTTDPNFVRIMTIHASKGLEFKHVGVSEVPFGTPKSSSLSLETFGDTILLGLQPALSKKASDAYKDLRSWREERDERSFSSLDIEGLSAGQIADLLDERSRQGALDDAQRLLYVALTRAVDSLYLCLPFKGDAKFTYGNKGILGLLHETFGWELSPDAKTLAFEYGGTRPALIRHEVLLDKDDADLRERAQENDFTVILSKEVPTYSFELASPRANVVSYSSIAPDHRQGEEEGVEDHDEFDMVEPTVESDAEVTLFDDAFFVDEEMFPEDMAAFAKQQSATALGTAFHRLAQRAIESRTEVGVVPELPASAFVSQVKLGDLSQLQEKRLDEATQRWFASDLCKRFFACEHIYAEVPFMLEINSAEHPLYLEGEIDGLAVSEADKEHAFFIDYKTGGSDEEFPERLHEKHLLQAQCYALALMRQGFKTVEAHFVRVERTSTNDPAQPQVVPYRFAAEEFATLEEAVLSAYEAHRS